MRTPSLRFVCAQYHSQKSVRAPGFYSDLPSLVCSCVTAVLRFLTWLNFVHVRLKIQPPFLSSKSFALQVLFPRTSQKYCWRWQSYGNAQNREWDLLSCGLVPGSLMVEARVPARTVRGRSRGEQEKARGIGSRMSGFDPVSSGNGTCSCYCAEAAKDVCRDGESDVNALSARGAYRWTGARWGRPPSPLWWRKARRSRSSSRTSDCAWTRSGWGRQRWTKCTR